jgi:hypothetical protein
MTVAAVVIALILLAIVCGMWFIKRKLARMADGLPGALQQWEKEIEKLEKPKG